MTDFALPHGGTRDDESRTDLVAALAFIGFLYFLGASAEGIFEGVSHADF